MALVHLMRKSTSQLLISQWIILILQAWYVCLKQTKTDQLRKDVTIVLGKIDQPPLCPVCAILSYLVVRGKEAGPLFICEGGQRAVNLNPGRDVSLPLALGCICRLWKDDNSVVGRGGSGEQLVGKWDG